VIELRGISASYRQGRSTVTPLRDVSVVLGPDPVALMGPSGSGKSTLLRIVAGLQEADAGTVVVDGQPVAPPTRRSAGDPRVALVHQDYRLVEFLSVGDNLRLCAELHSQTVTDASVEHTLDTVGLAGYADRQPATLSGGEQQRVAIARSLLSGATVLLADEPTGALDSDNTRLVTDMLIDLGRRDGTTVVVATHDVQVARRVPTIFDLLDGALVRGVEDARSVP
jgi:putative ABC transport system ATP-binding protein